MKKLLPLLFFLSPILTLAQETRGWSRELPHGFQVVATQDGHFMVLGSKTETAGEEKIHTPFLAKYSADGQLVFERYYSRASVTSMKATKMHLMGNGDLWVIGTAKKADGSEYHLLSRLSPATGDTIYMRLYSSEDYASTDFYLQPSPQGDRFYIVAQGFGGDVPASGVGEMSESFQPLQLTDLPLMGFHGGNPHPFSLSSPEGNILFYSTYAGTLAKISPNGDISVNNLNSHSLWGKYVLSAPTPAGDVIVLSDTKKLLLNGSLETVSEAPYSEYGPNMNREQPRFLKIAPSGFLASGHYESTKDKYSPFLMRLDTKGDLVWKRHVPAEEGTQVMDLASATDGEAVMLLKRGDQLRLVKTEGQGLLLKTGEEKSQAFSGTVLFPNPTNGNELNISFQKPFSGTVKIFNQISSLQHETTLKNSILHQFDLPDSIPPGVYFVELINPKRVKITLKLIKK